MDKIAGLKEILALDPKTALPATAWPWNWPAGARPSGAGRIRHPAGQRSRLHRRLLHGRADPCNAGRNAEAIERLKAGIASAERTGNNHALSEMQAMLDELDR